MFSIFAKSEQISMPLSPERQLHDRRSQATGRITFMKAVFSGGWMTEKTDSNFHHSNDIAQY